MNEMLDTLQVLHKQLYIYCMHAYTLSEPHLINTKAETHANPSSGSQRNEATVICSPPLHSFSYSYH